MKKLRSTFSPLVDGPVVGSVDETGEVFAFYFPFPLDAQFSMSNVPSHRLSSTVGDEMVDEKFSTALELYFIAPHRR